MTKRSFLKNLCLSLGSIALAGKILIEKPIFINKYEEFADYIGPVIRQILNKAGTTPLIYDQTILDTHPQYSYPLDLYYEKT